MKPSWSFILPSLCSVASAAGAGHVYIHDPTARRSPQAPSSVDPDTARLILAQRLGLSQFHSIKHAREQDIQQINAFGGRQQKLFSGEHADRTQAHALVWVEDVEDAGALIVDPSRWSSSFMIPNPPPASDNDRLIRDLTVQAESLPQKPDRKANTYIASTAIDAILSELKRSDLYNDYLTVFRADKTDKFSFSDLSATIDNLRQRATEGQGFSVTVVVMPPSPSHSKRSAQPYGAYDLPANHGPRRELTEAPLTPSTAKPATSPSPNVSDLEDFPTIAQAQSNVTTPVLGILPNCFKTKSKCEEQTNTCSGHGECVRRFKGDSNKRSDCYSCACKPDIKHVAENGMESKIKTTYWGGPACQKKDVSVPFWLFAGSGILLAFLISGGIGMLYSMGSEELPSVIGAGVSGPTRK